MNKFARLIFTLFLIAFFFFLWQKSLAPNLKSIYNSYFPCKKPITFSVDQFSNKFGITESDFKKSIIEAENIWQTPSGLNLFQNVETDGEVKINLIYDYRQMATNKLAKIKNVVVQNSETYDELKKQYTTLNNSYNEMKNVYLVKQSDFLEAQQNYIAHVQTANNNGGATKEEFAVLKEEKANVSRLFNILETSRAEINAKLEDLNSTVSDLNASAKVINAAATQYNGEGEIRGETFTEGEFVSDGLDIKKINVYEFTTHQKLVRVLAHELGHSLGIGHATDTDAIMYALNESKKMTLTKNDLELLKDACKIE